MESDNLTEAQVLVLNSWFCHDFSDKTTVKLEDLKELSGVQKYDTVVAKLKALTQQKDVEWAELPPQKSKKQKQFTCSLNVASHILAKLKTAKSIAILQLIIKQLFSVVKRQRSEMQQHSAAEPADQDSQIEEGVRVPSPPEPELGVFVRQQMEIMQALPSTIAAAIAAAVKPPSQHLAIEDTTTADQDVEEPVAKRPRKSTAMTPQDQKACVNEQVRAFIDSLRDEHGWFCFPEDVLKGHYHQWAGECRLCQNHRITQNELEALWIRYHHEHIADFPSNKGHIPRTWFVQGLQSMGFPIGDVGHGKERKRWVYGLSYGVVENVRS